MVEASSDTELKTGLKTGVETAFLGLGGNLGQPEIAIHQALALLSAHADIEVLAVSSFYQTEPVGMAFSEGATIPWFVNAAARIETRLSAQALMAFCLEVEHQLGRDRTLLTGQAAHDRDALELGGSSMPMPSGGALSRTVDVDLLFYGQHIIGESGLTVPHPRLHERAFALYPLRELAPTWVHPVFGQTIEALTTALIQACRMAQGEDWVEPMVCPERFTAVTPASHSIAHPALEAFLV